MVEPYGKDGNTESLRQTVFALLDGNPDLTAKPMSKLLGLPYEKSYRYLNKLKNDWKSYRQNEQGSNRLNIHGWRGYCCVPYTVKRDLAVSVGCVLTKSRNRFLLWKDSVGRMEWFETGKVNLHVKTPANLGRVKQLVCNGFFRTGLIVDNAVLEKVGATIRLREAHYVFDVGKPFPRSTIDYFGRSHGIIIKTGDKSHRRAVEVISRCPDWAERNELLLERLTDLLGGTLPDKFSSKKPDYVA